MQPRLIFLLTIFLCGRAEDAAVCEDESCMTEEVGTSLLMTSLKRKAGDANLKVRKSWDGKTMNVQFEHNGKTLKYKLSGSTLYGKAGEATLHTAEGKQDLVKSGRMFRSTAFGKKANVLFKKDGTVSGLFEHEGGIIKLFPQEGDSSALLESTHRSHATEQLKVPHFGARNVRVTKERGDGVHDPDVVKLVTDADGQHTWHVGAEAHPEQDLTHGATATDEPAWTGTRWWPGCYSGSAQQHIFTMKIIGDVQAHNEWGDGLQDEMELAFSEASFIYEQQLNIRLEIGALEIFSDNQTAPDFAKAICNNDNSEIFMERMLMGLTHSSQPHFASTHIFTGCGDGWGIIGLAWMGTICSRNGHNTGINQLRGPSTFLTFAHELGHNFGGGHSFEEGQGTTGGIMDYGDGLLDGAYQFNTRYRKEEMCWKANQVVNDCEGNFVPDLDTPVAPTLPPTPAPTFAPLPDGTWEVIEGNCRKTASDCMTSPNFPQHYPNSAPCMIMVGPNFGSISAVNFQTEEGYDGLFVGESVFTGMSIDGFQIFHGSDGPQNLELPAGTIITWHADDSVTERGWRLCRDGNGDVPSLPPSPAPTGYPTGPPSPTWNSPASFPTYSPSPPLPEVDEGEWVVFQGNCTIGDDGCVTSPNFPDEYPSLPHGDFCFILVGPNFGTVSATSFDTQPHIDVLLVGSEHDHAEYSGTEGPQGVDLPAGGGMVWWADPVESRGGWKVCRDGSGASGPDGGKKGPDGGKKRL